MKHGCLISNCNIPPYAMNWFDFGIELSLSVVCVCHLICGVNIWIFRGIWPHWKCDAITLNRFSQSSRCKRMCGYLYGKFDCWLILNSRNTIYIVIIRNRIWHGALSTVAKQVMLPQIKSTLYFAVLPKRTIANDRLMWWIYGVVVADVLFINFTCRLFALFLCSVSWLNCMPANDNATNPENGEQAKYKKRY